jgi:hypothetical protein
LNAYICELICHHSPQVRSQNDSEPMAECVPDRVQIYITCLTAGPDADQEAVR